MGKIDFNALRREAEAKEVKGEENEVLQTAYEKVWGKNKETIENLAMNLISPFKNRKGKKQPFKLNKEKVNQIKASAKDIGIITPLIVRRNADGYQILSGHHRFQAAKELGLLTVPCVIREVSDEDADKYVIEANIQRIKLLPSEYGAIFDRYMEMRKDLDLTAEEISDKFGVSRKNMYRYLNVNKLIPELQELVDKDRINVDCPDLFITLTEEQQKDLSDVMERNDHKVTLTQAKKIVALFGDNAFNEEAFLKIYEKAFTYKNKLYKELSKKYNITMSEDDLDNLVRDYLESVFAKQGSVG
jgi:ParB family chromosome partitioning protein